MISCNDQYELSKTDTQMAKGIAILGMVMLHLFCRLDNLPYTPLIYIGEKPLIYYFGLFGDMCVPIYCFCSGYAHYLLREKEAEAYSRRIPERLFRFLSNYWIILIMFSVLGFFFDKTGEIPGSVSGFLGNLLLYNVSYNGAWWFVVTYVIIMILSPCLCWLSRRIPTIILMIASGSIYFVAYLFRFVLALEFDSPVLSWIWTQWVLLGTSQFGYILGMVFRKNRWISWLRSYFSRVGNSAAQSKAINRCVIHGVPLILFFVHCIEPSLIVAPITGLGTVVCFWLWRKPRWAEQSFLFFGKHSTNIWLVHMFFYSVLFRKYIFYFKFPILIFVAMLGITVAISMLVNHMHSLFICAVKNAILKDN